MAGKSDGVARVAGLRYWGAADARVVVEAWRGSGERLSEFARRQGIKPRRLGQWARRLESPGEGMAFHPVRVVEAAGGDGRRGPKGEPIEIVMGDGRSVRVPPGFAAQDLERVLSVLGARPTCC
jgi:hypothetical protein